MSNVVVMSGRISDHGIKPRLLPSGKWELSLTLYCDEMGRDGQLHTLYVPVLVYGASCEALYESLGPRDVVLITGKLSWTKKSTKDGEKSGLAVTTFGVERFHTADATEHEPAPAYGSGVDDAEISHEAPKRPRRRGYPQAALLGGFPPN